MFVSLLIGDAVVVIFAVLGTPGGSPQQVFWDNAAPPGHHSNCHLLQRSLDTSKYQVILVSEQSQGSVCYENWFVKHETHTEYVGT